jgi:hypothetical protein
MGRTSTTLRKILGPFIFLFGLGYLLFAFWIYLTWEGNLSFAYRLLGGLLSAAISSTFILVGYDWMRGRVSMKLPNWRNDRDK